MNSEDGSTRSERMEGLIISDPQAEFSPLLKKIMEKKGVFSENAHIYLTNLMTQYASRNDECSPSINARGTRPFILQLKDIEQNSAFDATIRYAEFRRLGDTLLMSTGYFPESFSNSTADFEYFPTLGAVAYSRAAGAALRKARLSGQASMMKNMSEGFLSYVAVLYCTRHEIGDKPVTDIALMNDLAILLNDDSASARYLLRKMEKEIEEKYKIIIKGS